MLSESLYTPTDVMIRLLCPRPARYQPLDVWTRTCRQVALQVRFAVWSSLNAICEREPEDYLVVRRSGIVTGQFVAKIRCRLDVEDVEFDAPLFRLRFGEELLCWHLQDPESGEPFRLRIAACGGLVVAGKRR